MSETQTVESKEITAQTIKLLFGPSTSGKSMILIEGNNMFMVNNTTYKEILDRKIAKLIFTKGAKLPEQPGKPEMWGWRPSNIEATKMAGFEQEAVEVEAEARLFKAKIDLKKFKAEFKD